MKPQDDKIPYSLPANSLIRESTSCQDEKKCDNPSDKINSNLSSDKIPSDYLQNKNNQTSASDSASNQSFSPVEARQKAMQAFTEGYNCAQSVVKAFADIPEIQEKVNPQVLLSLASSFGGGVGRLREVCGTVSGMAIILGILYGYSGPETGQPKADHYARIQELAKQFEEKNGSIICRELLGLSVKHDIPTPEARTEEYYKKRPCKELAGCMAEILAEYIQTPDTL